MKLKVWIKASAYISDSEGILQPTESK